MKGLGLGAMSHSLKRKSDDNQVSFANPLDDDGMESPRSSEPSTPRTLASLKTSPNAGKERLVLTGMSLEDMFMAIDPDASGVVDAKELSEFAGLIGVRSCSPSAQPPRSSSRGPTLSDRSPTP